MPENDDQNPWFRLLVVASSALATMAIGAGGYVIMDTFERIRVLEGLVHGANVTLAELVRGSAMHERDADYWKQRIDGNERRLDECERGQPRPERLNSKE